MMNTRQENPGQITSLYLSIRLSHRALASKSLNLSQSTITLLWTSSLAFQILSQIRRYSLFYAVTSTRLSRLYLERSSKKCCTICLSIVTVTSSSSSLASYSIIHFPNFQWSYFLLRLSTLITNQVLRTVSEIDLAQITMIKQRKTKKKRKPKIPLRV